MMSRLLSVPVLLVRARCMGQLFIEGLAIADAAAEKLWPIRHGRQRILLLRHISSDLRQ